MCGIVGVVGERAVEKAIKVLKRLEYRGYDSCGIACLVNKKLEVVKTLGSATNLRIPSHFREAKVAIGHTRWATHGKVSLENTQPVVYFDYLENNYYATVHNGMITNYREFLNTDLDSAVIPLLFSKGYSPEKVMSILRGVITSLTLTSKGEVIAIRRGTPLVIGRTKDGWIFSSDYQSILDMAEEFAIIPDETYVRVNLNSPNSYYSSANLTWIKPSKSEVYYEFEEVSAGYYTYSEIMQQSYCLTNCLENKEKIQEFVEELRKFDRILFLGAGSSYHACLYGKLLLLGKVCCVQAIPASEFLTEKLVGRTAIVAISQSGETADLLYVLNKVSDKCKIFGITNNPYSTLMQMSYVCLNQDVGTEYSVIATKTFTSQLVLLYLVNRVWEGELDIGIENVIRLQRNISSILNDKNFNDLLEKVAEKLSTTRHLFVLGRGLEYVTALETALKFKEACCIHAEALPSGELKHGALALVEGDFPIVAFVSSSDERTLLNLAQVKSRGGLVIGISPIGSEYFDIWIKVPEFGDLNPVIQVISAQLLAYHVAKRKGLNPDRPRNLAKTVTVL